MKRVSDDRINNLFTHDLCGLRGETINDIRAIAKELQAWRSAFKGVEMVVPVRETIIKGDMDDGSDDAYVLRAANGRELIYCWASNRGYIADSVIRLDEIFGTEGTK